MVIKKDFGDCSLSLSMKNASNPIVMVEDTIAISRCNKKTNSITAGDRTCNNKQV